MTALEVFSTVHALLRPWDALDHRRLLTRLKERCVRGPRRAKWRTLRLLDSALEP